MGAMAMGNSAGNRRARYAWIPAKAGMTKGRTSRCPPFLSYTHLELVEGLAHPDSATSSMATLPWATAAWASLMAPASRLGSSTRSPCPPKGDASCW